MGQKGVVVFQGVRSSGRAEAGTGSEGESVRLRRHRLWVCRQKQTRVSGQMIVHPILVQVNIGKRVWALSSLQFAWLHLDSRGSPGHSMLVLGRMSALYFHVKYF